MFLINFFKVGVLVVHGTQFLPPFLKAFFPLLLHLFLFWELPHLFWYIFQALLAFTWRLTIALQASLTSGLSSSSSSSTALASSSSLSELSLSLAFYKAMSSSLHFLFCSLIWIRVFLTSLPSSLVSFMSIQEMVLSGLFQPFFISKTSSRVRTSSSFLSVLLKTLLSILRALFFFLSATSMSSSIKHSLNSAMVS